MKKHLLAVTVLVALGCTAWGETTISRAEEKPAAAPAGETEEAKKARLEKEAKDKAAEEARKKAAAAEEAAKKTRRVQQTKEGVFVELDNDRTLYVEAGSCGTEKCSTQRVLDIKFTENVSDLLAALYKSKLSDKSTDEDSVRTALRKSSREEDKKDDIGKAVRKELADAVSHCGIDVKEGKRSSVNFELESLAMMQNGMQQVDTATSERARCSAKAVAEFMDDKAEEFESDDYDLEDLKLKEEELADAVRFEKDPKKKEQKREFLEKFRAEVKVIRNKKSKTVEATRAFIRNNVLTDAVSDLAKNPSINGPTYLQGLAAHTPDMFSDVRKDVGTSMLQIYRLQTQSYLSYRDQANRTSDPQQKAFLQGRADSFKAGALQYGTYMNTIQSRSDLGYMASRAGREMDGSISPNAVIGDVFSQYAQPSQQITSYLTGTGTNGQVVNPALPQTLNSCVSDGWLPCLPTTATINGVTTVNGQNSALIRGNRVMGTGVGTPNMNTNGLPIRGGQQQIQNNGRVNGRFSTGLPAQIPR